MKAAQFFGGVVLGLVVGVGFMAFRPMGTGGTPPPPPKVAPQDRVNTVTLIRNAAGTCQAFKTDPIRGYPGDTIRWEIHDTCGLGRTPVRITFTDQNPDDGTGTFEETFNANGEARLHVKVKDLSSVPKNASPGWRFPYVLRIVVNGTPTDLRDPQLEVDPN